MIKLTVLLLCIQQVVLTDRSEIIKKAFRLCNNGKQPSEKLLSDYLYPKAMEAHKCLFACVSNQLGLLEDGKLRYDKLMMFASESSPTGHIIQQRPSLVQQCIHTVPEKNDQCEYVYRMRKCLQAIVEKVLHEKTIDYDDNDDDENNDDNDNNNNDNKKGDDYDDDEEDDEEDDDDKEDDDDDDYNDADNDEEDDDDDDDKEDDDDDDEEDDDDDDDKEDDDDDDEENNDADDDKEDDDDEENNDADDDKEDDEDDDEEDDDDDDKEDDDDDEEDDDDNKHLRRKEEL